MKNPVWVVMSVQPKKDYTLHLTFADGTEKVYDAHPLLEKEIYAKLKNISFFLSAKVECGTVVWNEDIDIAPEHLYECSLEMLAEKKVSIDSAYKQLQIISQDKAKRMEYEAREKAVRDYSYGIYEAEQRGMQHGMEQGMKQGMEQGAQ